MVALAVIESFGGIGGRICPLIGGPCTIGPGRIISHSLSTTFRTHLDLEENSDLILVYEKACKFYNSLISIANKKGVSIDLFAFSLTQFGMKEMKNLIEKTGGVVMNEEEFI